MAAGPSMTARLDELIALFNRRSLDLPDGLFDRRTQFLLNGTPFEAMLGRSPADPLVLMIARGPAGYRFATKALQHAVLDARVERGEIEELADSDRWTVPLWLSGHLRGTDRPVEAVMRATVVPAGSAVSSADLAVDEAVVQALREARLRD
jgi:hypothetical protein